MWNSLLKPLKVPSVHQIDINIFKHKFRKYLLKQLEIGDETAKYDNIHTVNYIMIKKQISIFIYYAPRIFLRV